MKDFLNRHSLLLIFLLALVLRLVFVAYLGDRMLNPIRDQALYNRLAKSLLLDSEITVSAGLQQSKVAVSAGDEVNTEWVKTGDTALGGIPVDKPTSYWDPFYIYVYAGLMKMGLRSVIWIRLFNVLTGSLVVFFAFGIGNMLLNRRLGIWLGLITAIYPYFIYYSVVIMPDVLVIMLTAAVIWATLKAAKSATLIRGIVVGVLVGILALTRSNIMVFYPLILLFIFLYKFKKVLLGKKLLAVAVALVSFTVVLSPWVLRNYAVHQQLVLMPTRTGINLWMRNNPIMLTLEMETAGQSIPQSLLDNLRRKDLLELPVFDPNMGEVERNQILTGRMMEFISANPGYFAYLSWLRLGDFLAVVGPNERSIGAFLAGWLSYGIAIPLALIGLWLSRRQWRELWVIQILILYYIISHALMHGGIQYRLPMDTFILFFALFTVNHFYEKWHKKALPIKEPQ